MLGLLSLLRGGLLCRLLRHPVKGLQQHSAQRHTQPMP